MSRILLLMSLMIHQAAFGLEVDLPSGETIELERHDAAIRIDGVLDETVWSGLDQFDEFVVVEPDTLVDPEYQTLVSLFFNERGLYVGVWVKQPPETHQTDQDQTRLSHQAHRRSESRRHVAQAQWFPRRASRFQAQKQPDG